MNFLLDTLRLGLASLLMHKLRSLLTALGIIFGVAAVISMVAIGEGNKHQALAAIKLLGARNIIIRSVKPAESQAPQTTRSHAALAYGITRLDVERIGQTVGGIDRLVPLKQVGSKIIHGQKLVHGAVLGTIAPLREVASLTVQSGRYLTDLDRLKSDNVAVVGATVAKQLFPLEDALGGLINVDGQAFRVVGVLQQIGLGTGEGAALVGRDLNLDVHIPLETANARYGDVTINRRSGTFEASRVELSELYIQVSRQQDVPAVAQQLSLLLDKAHQAKGDISTVVPYQLLEQVERTQRMFNAFMIAIASISLLVGGIGIMNIMLASVTERTREIGIRRALGATQHHIVAQFLVETTVLSGLGGLLGVAVGLLGTALLGFVGTWVPAMAPPRVTAWSIVVSVVVATLVGVAFGIYPAAKAAKQDPIVALRHD